MAKKSCKRSAKHPRNHSGCMSALISMFDFRNGRSTLKLLPDRRQGNRHIVAVGNAMDKSELLMNLDQNCRGTVDGEESPIAAVDVGNPSMKKLMEDEMLGEKDSKKERSCTEMEPRQCNSEHGGRKRKNRKRTNRSRTKSCESYMEDLDVAENLQPEKPCLQCLDKHYTNSFDIDDMVRELCHQICLISGLNDGQCGDNHDQPNQKHAELEENLREAIEFFIKHRLVNRKHGKGDGDIYTSKELKDALKILCCDKELSLKLLQGPKSAMVKYIENVWNAQVEKDEVYKLHVTSSLSEHEIHDLKQSDEVFDSKQPRFFKRKTKSAEKTPSRSSNGTQASNKIVILKPGSTSLEKPETEGSIGSTSESRPFIRNRKPDARVGAHFFFSEIKRKLMQAMGKERQSNISKRFPNKHLARADTDKRSKEVIGRNSPNKDHFFIEKIVRPSNVVKKGEKKDKLKECETSTEHGTESYSSQRVSNIYVQAKKHLSEMVTSGNGDVGFSSRQDPKSLGRILSLPMYNFSPFSSPGRDWGQGFIISARMRSSADDKFQKLENNVSHLDCITQSSESEVRVSDESTDSKAEASANPNSIVSNEIVQDIEVGETPSFVGGGTTSEGDVEIVKADDIVIQEDINASDSVSEPSDSFTTRDDQHVRLSDFSNEKGYSECLKLGDSDEEIQHQSSLLMFPSAASITKKDDDLECVIEVSDRPSPVSVLEPFFTEEDIIPPRTRYQPAEAAMKPLRIQFEDHGPSATDLSTHLRACTQDKKSVFEYIKSVLEASEVDWDEFYIMSNSSDPLLDPSVYDEVEFFPNQLCHDKKLLFDCTNEVLLEVYGRHFGFPLGLSFGKPTVQPAPDLELAIREVCEGAYWYLLPLALPRTLEKTVKKDMSKTGSWMNLRSDSETMVIEIGESVFKDLVEETIWSCVSQDLEVGDQH